MKTWRVILDFFVYRAENVEQVRSLLPVITAQHHPFHTDILPKAKITELTNEKVFEHQIDDSVQLVSHLISINRDLMQNNATEWEIPMSDGNKFIWVKKKTMGLKLCNTCNKEKELNDFAPTGEWGKRKGRCRQCDKEARLKRRQQN